jgi:hypothetical protein
VLTLLLAATLAAAVFLWRIDQRTRELAVAEDALSERVTVVNDTLAAMETAQHGYVAPGQLDEPWFDRMSTLVDELKSDLAAVLLDLRSPDAVRAIEALNASLATLVGSDERVRENLSRGQELMAADVIFSDGRNLVDAMTASLRKAQSAERASTRSELAALEQDRWTVLGLTALLWFVVVVALIRRPPAAARSGATSTEPATAAPPAMQPRGVTAAELAAAAALCTDLSRVADTAALSTLLGRAASLVDASGAILWLGDGARLFAVLGHGYTQQALARFGPIGRDADNAVAATWRTGRPSAIGGRGSAGGAFVTPVFGASGCIGALAFETRPGDDCGPERQALAAVFAAQVATAVAVGPAPTAAQPAAEPSKAKPA